MAKFPDEKITRVWKDLRERLGPNIGQLGAGFAKMAAVSAIGDIFPTARASTRNTRRPCAR